MHLSDHDLVMDRRHNRLQLLLLVVSILDVRFHDDRERVGQLYSPDRCLTSRGTGLPPATLDTLRRDTGHVAMFGLAYTWMFYKTGSI